MGQMDLRGLRRAVAIAAITGSLAAQVRVSEDPSGAAQLTTQAGSKRVPKERGQVSIGDPGTAVDGRTAGWLVLYNVEGVSYPIAGTLVVWRDGRIIRRFQTEQTFYSWSFVGDGKQVAYHTGPLHGETKSHCELRNVSDGRLVAQWDGNLQDAAKRPAWTAGLNH